ncbi:MAG: O-antigen ligase family protein [Candidatus Eisenbacteria bacterium]|nr:O-antigen ligase family protein [Candidatus Eisenbacteria bacterium]
MAMSVRLKHWWHADRDPLMRVIQILAVVALGIVIGTQYMTPDKRMLSVAAGALVFGIAWRLDTLTGLGLLIIALPYPRPTVFGGTNFAFILLLLLIWLLRVAQRMSPRPRATPLDIPIAGWVLAYAISFYNVANAEDLGYAMQSTEQFIVCLLLFYLLVSNIRTVADLQRIQAFQAVSLATILLIAVYELNHPNGTLIPGWIIFTNTSGGEFNLKNVRVGGPFFDFELLSEFCAVSSLLVAFLYLRARSIYGRAALAALLLLDIFVLFATVTRGAMISLGVGLLYLLFRVRRRVRVVPLTLVAGAIAGLATGMNFFVSHFTRSGDVGARLRGTHFVGLVPDSRVQAWAGAWDRFLEHPLIGHGPYYSSQTGSHIWYWPHNGYLYIANLFGLFGLTFYFALLITLFRITNRSSEDLHDPDYARAFLLVANVQLVVFIVDQIKIDYLRNTIYQFEVWVMFAMMVAASRVAQSETVRAKITRPLPFAA